MRIKTLSIMEKNLIFTSHNKTIRAGKKLIPGCGILDNYLDYDTIFILKYMLFK